MTLFNTIARPKDGRLETVVGSRLRLDPDWAVAQLGAQASTDLGLKTPKAGARVGQARASCKGCYAAFVYLTDVILHQSQVGFSSFLPTGQTSFNLLETIQSMPTIGPELPPHLGETSSPQPTTKKRAIGPELPPHLQASRPEEQEEEEEENLKNYTNSSEPPVKRLRTIGPTPPQHSLAQSLENDEEQDDINQRADERPLSPPSSSNEDDDYGPSLPGVSSSKAMKQSNLHQTSQHWDKHNPLASSPAKGESGPPKRDDWMMMPPQADDLAARMDPLKQSARKFSSKPVRRAAGENGGTGMWTESADEKRKRLEREVLGISVVNPTPAANSSNEEARKVRLTEKRKGDKKKEPRNVKDKGTSLYERNKFANAKSEEDDPSQRAFDYERDMSVASKMANKQKRELVHNAKNMGGRFSKGGSL